MKQNRAYFQKIRDIVGRLSREIHQIWQYIHDHPETGYRENEASKKLAEWLQEHGFQVKRGIADMPTAFLAEAGSKRPKVAYLAEYDALPGVGHACGHSLSGIASVIAGTTLAELACSGTVVVMGTPAEEGVVPDAGGKLKFVDSGLFRDVDAVLMAHAAAKTVLQVPVLARVVLDVEWHGKAAHAGAAPDKGRNAVNAMILGLNACNALYQQLGDECRMNAVIRAGGALVNTIPDYAAASLQLRAPVMSSLEDMVKRVSDCLRAGGLATGCETKFSIPSRAVADIHHDRFLLEIYAGALEWLGVKYKTMDKGMAISTDAGNASYEAPLIHPFFGIESPDMPELHSADFARACGTDSAYQSMESAATALAITGFEVLSQGRMKQEQKGKPVATNQLHGI